MYIEAKGTHTKEVVRQGTNKHRQTLRIYIEVMQWETQRNGQNRKKKARQRGANPKTVKKKQKKLHTKKEKSKGRAGGTNTQTERQMEGIGGRSLMKIRLL